MKAVYLFLALIWTIGLFAQPVPIESVRNSCGSGYFIDNESNQAAMLVRGFFCGNSYFYTRNQVIGRYGFNEGLLQDLEEFMPNGTPILQLHFEQGKQHGEQRAYNRNGVLERMSTYVHGLLHGPFFYAWYGDFDQCVVKGYVDHGSYTYEKGFEPCDESGDNNK